MVRQQSPQVLLKVTYWLVARAHTLAETPVPHGALLGRELPSCNWWPFPMNPCSALLPGHSSTFNAGSEKNWEVL